MTNNGIDPATSQWRSMFAELCRTEWEHNRQLLEEIRRLVRKQNAAVEGNVKAIHGNALEIARLKTWVALMGGGIGLIGIAAALLQALK